MGQDPPRLALPDRVGPVSRVGLSVLSSHTFVGPGAPIDPPNADVRPPDLFAPWVEGRWLQLPQLLQLGTTQQLQLDELWVFEQFAIRACRAGAFCWG